MAIEKLNITMLGDFTIRAGDRVLSSNRTGKVWLLLAYLIYHRNRRITPEELYTLLWGEDEGSDDPQNALKALVHRVRNTLDALDPVAGRELILWRDGHYAWNTDVPFTLDVADFESLCAEADRADPSARLELLEQAIGIYRGDLLSRFSSEAWILPLSVYYHNLYLRAVESALELLESSQRLNRAAELCRDALAVEPYSEELYKHLLRNLVDSGKHEDAVKAFEIMSDRFFATFGIMPSEEIRAIYREANSRTGEQSLSPDELRQYVKELQTPPGPICCDYDSFRLLYQAHARAIVRNGDAVHIALISVSGKSGEELSRRIMNRAVDSLIEKIRQSLRTGDVVARCSVSQAVIMLPQANYENSCMVCERVLRLFRTAHPHSTAQLNYAVLPVEPASPQR